MRRRFRLGLAVLAVLLMLTGVWLLHRRDSPPAWVSWEGRQIVCQPENGEPEKIVLARRTVTVYSQGEAVWQPDREIQVQDVLWGDIDHDGAGELMLLCWRRGRYGSSRPFWVTEDETVWSQHIYLYDWTEGTIRPIWMASDIGMEVTQWSFGETSRLVLTDRTGAQSAWDWISWGLQWVEPSTLTFAAVGDNLIHRQIYDYAFRQLDGCFDSLFAAIQEELSQYDVTSINQETIYVDRREDYSDYPLFGTPIEVGEAVIKAGFDIVSCATNHTLDKGTAAIDLTAALYESAGITYAGIQPSASESYEPFALFEKNGIRCAVFSYTQFTNGIPVPEETPYVLHVLEEEQVRADLAAGRAAADLCLVYVHWGTEYAAEPDDSQREWAQRFADYGADVVIGAHPHVVQSYEWVTGSGGNQTLVYYSLGNFVSAQSDEACRRGGLAWFTVQKENGRCTVTDCGLKGLLTENDNGCITTRLAAP